MNSYTEDNNEDDDDDDNDIQAQLELLRWVENGHPKQKSNFTVQSQEPS